MARAAFLFKTVGFGGLQNVPINDELASHLLRAGNSPWQLTQFLDWISLGRGLATSALVPAAGSRYYQMSCLLSGTLQIPFRPNHRWGDVRFLRLVWSSPTLDGLVVAPPQVLAQPALQALADRAYDCDDYPFLARDPRFKHRIFQQLSAITLLNLTGFGPISFVRVDEDMWSGDVNQLMMNYFGHTFAEIAYTLCQASANRPWEHDGTYARMTQIILSLFWLSYVGVIHQQNTYRTFYFQCNRRGDAAEVWILSCSLNHSAQIRPGNRSLFVVPTSPDWNMDVNLILSSTLTGCLCSGTQLPLIDNNSVPNASRNIHGWTGRGGSQLHGFQVRRMVTEFCDRLRRDGVMTQAQQNQVEALADQTQQFKRDKLETWAREDDQYNQAHPNSTMFRTKPFTNAQWGRGNTAATSAAIAALI
uniref:Sigma 2 inner capsid protein n=1 Tax=Mammalian orthoreovirus TaxID=351073 RepID=A0A8A1G1C1_9REOV|nr:sigma 2 inner capsid protein [Mammalian orthoreovirus]